MTAYKVSNNNVGKEVDVLLIFPPLIEDLPYPPAGIPYIVSYLKSHHHNPYVLDVDSLFKKSFLMYKILFIFQSRILSFRKSRLNVSSNINKCQDTFRSGDGWKQIIKKTGLSILKEIFQVKKVVVKAEPLPLDQALKIFSSKISILKIERRLRPILRNFTADKNITCLGISVIYPNQILYALVIAKIMKKMHKDMLIVLGGPQITMHIRRLISNAELTDYIDGFIIHEGEIPLDHLINNLKIGKSLNDIPNLYYKKEDRYIPSGDVNFITPIEEYGIPDFLGFALNSYLQSLLPIRTLRGCFWGKCTFCSYPYISGKFGLVKPEFVVDSIETLQKKYNVNRFEFIDSSVPAGFLNEIANIIRKKNLKIRWNCRVNFQKEFRNVEFVKLLKDSGCESLALGVESGTNRIIKLMNKMQENTDVVLEILQVLKAQGIIPVIYIIIGFPTETKSEISQTIDFVMRLKKDFGCALSGIGAFNLLENTYIFDHPEEFKIKNISKESYVATQGYGCRYTSEGATKEEVYCMQRKANFFIRHPFLYGVIHKNNVENEYRKDCNYHSNR